MRSDSVDRFAPFDLSPPGANCAATSARSLSAHDERLQHVQRTSRATAPSKDELLDIVWPDVFVEAANLAVQVSALRKVLGPRRSPSSRLAAAPDRDRRCGLDGTSTAA
jgi:hypothetical protein